MSGVDYASREFLPNPQVESLNRAPLGQPFDVDRFVSDPEPKVFDPNRIISASERFDVDDFIRTIHEGRDVERKERSG